MRCDILDGTLVWAAIRGIQALAGGAREIDTMRCGIILTAGLLAMLLAAMTAPGAQAQEYCGFNPKPGAIVECGYSSLEGCQNDIGKGAMCFVNPYLVFNERRATPFVRS
jgi:hypothetical protein